MAVKIIACEVMKEELLAIKAKKHIVYEFVSLGLHRYPQKLHKELQHMLDHSWGYTNIILAFGLCGGAARHLQAVDSPLIIPRVHDCIPILLGSQQAYVQCSSEAKGTFYLSHGWTITEQNILTDHQRILAKYGVKKALSILYRMYNGYQKVLFIHTGCAQEAVSLEQSQQIADLLQLSHHTIQGDSAYLHKIVNGPWREEEFIHIAPFTRIEEELFNLQVKPGTHNEVVARPGTRLNSESIPTG